MWGTFYGLYTLSINSRIASKSIGKWGDLVHCGFAKYVYPDHSTTFFWERNIYNYSSGGGVVPLMFYPKDTAIT
jgi:hypothetical protein